jgi:hypothetical protein
MRNSFMFPASGFELRFTMHMAVLQYWLCMYITSVILQDGTGGVREVHALYWWLCIPRQRTPEVTKTCVQVLDVSANQLTSLAGLAHVHTLRAAHNPLTTLRIICPRRRCHS